MPLVLRMTQFLLDFSGCHESTLYEHRHWYSAYRAFAFFGLFILCEPLTRFITTTMDDLGVAINAASMLLIAIVSMSNFLLLAVNRRHLTAVLSTLQSEFDQNKPFNLAHFRRAHRLSRHVELINNISITVTCVCFLLQPLVRIAWHRARGSFTADMMVLPTPCILPFDMQSPGGYALGFAIHIIFITYNMTVCMAVDGLFIGACIFAEAYLDDLIEHIRHADKSYARTGNGRVLRGQLVKAVRRHLEFYVWYRHFAQLTTGIIFMKFEIYSLEIAFFVFLFGSDGGGDSNMKFLLSGSTMLLEIFILCYISTRVITKILHVGEALYSIQWYKYPIRMQRFVQMMVRQSQQVNNLNGWGLVDCSLESFMAMLNFICSMTALLQGMK